MKTYTRYFLRQSYTACASSRSKSTSRYIPSSRSMVSPRVSSPWGSDGSVSVAGYESRHPFRRLVVLLRSQFVTRAIDTPFLKPLDAVFRVAQSLQLKHGKLMEQVIKVETFLGLYAVHTLFHPVDVKGSDG